MFVYPFALLFVSLYFEVVGIAWSCYDYSNASLRLTYQCYHNQAAMDTDAVADIDTAVKDV